MAGRQRDPLIIEKGLGSVAKIRILRILSKEGEGLTRYLIQQRSGLRWNSVITSLSDLVEIGWVIEVQTNPQKYRVNMDDEVVRNFLEFLSRAQ